MEWECGACLCWVETQNARQQEHGASVIAQKYQTVDICLSLSRSLNPRATPSIAMVFATSANADLMRLCRSLPRNAHTNR